MIYFLNLRCNGNDIECTKTLYALYVGSLFYSVIPFLFLGTYQQIESIFRQRRRQVARSIDRDRCSV